MKRKVIISTVLATLLFGTSALVASSDYSDSVSVKEAKALNNPASVVEHAKAQAKVEETNSRDLYEAKLDNTKFNKEVAKEDARRLKKIVNNEYSRHKRTLKKAPKEVGEGLHETVIALRALQQHKTQDAKKALNKATQLFDKAFKADPKLDLVPIADNVTVNDFTGDSKLVKHLINSTEKLLKKHDTQMARDMLLPLQDEMVMTTDLLPMGAYPKATKEALKELNNGKNKLAFSTLAIALNSVVVDTTVIPLPLITAQDLVIEASQLDKSKKKEATKLLTQAQDELEKAVLLGYTKKHSTVYKSLYKQIENIKKEIKGKNIVEKMYGHIKDDFKSLVHSHEKDVTRKQK